MTKRLKNTYYYVQGHKVALKRSSAYVALHVPHSSETKLLPGSRKRFPMGCRELTSALALVNVREAGAHIDEFSPGLEEQPVYRTEEALVIPLPEIRIEEHRPAHRKHVRAWLREREENLRVARDRDGRFDIYVRSGSGDEAIRIANRIHEEVRPEMSQARFVRIAKRPPREK